MSAKALENKNADSSNSETVKVAIRCRPMNKKEMQNNHEVVVKINTKRSEIFVERPGGEENPKNFTFDQVYDWNALQSTIFEQCAKPIVDNILEGYNGTIFAYGQTGTGKTHTMTGVEGDPD